MPITVDQFGQASLVEAELISLDAEVEVGIGLSRSDAELEQPPGRRCGFVDRPAKEHPSDSCLRAPQLQHRLAQVGGQRVTMTELRSQTPPGRPF